MSLYQHHIQHLQTIFDTALSQADVDQVLIYSGEQGYGFLDDNAFGFKTNPYFKYWIPLPQQQKSFIKIEIGQKPTLYLFQQEDYWHAQPVVPEGEWQAHFDLKIIDDPQTVIAQHLSKATKTAVIGDMNNRAKEWPSNNVNPERLLSFLDFNRAYKTEWEKHNLREANRLAAKGHFAAKLAFYNGASEFETHLAYLQAIKTRELNLPYNNIIAFNQNASVLHYDNYAAVAPSKAHSFLIDAGAEVNGYNADISRTYLKSGTEEIRLFEAMYETYKVQFTELLAEIEIGKPYLQFHDSAHKRIANMLSEFDIVRCSGEDAYEKGYSQLFFPCGVGHYIGAQVHDVGGYLASEQGETLDKDSRYPFLRLMRPIENNIAFTVEPGIYFIETLLKQHKTNKDFNWSLIEHLSQFGGFRLEDTVIMNNGEAENISAHLVAY